MKCTNCQMENEFDGDMHCRMIFKEKFERLLGEGKKSDAVNFYFEFDFIDFNSKLWKQDLFPDDGESRSLKNEKEKCIEHDELRKKYGHLLDKIEGDGRLDNEEVAVLEKGKQFENLASYFQKLYETDKDLWDLSKACKYYRKAGFAGLAIKITESIPKDVYNNCDLKALSAILTARGAAFRQLDELDKAKKCAEKAIRINENSHHPYILLGAILIEERFFEKAFEYFKKAKILGADPVYCKNEIIFASRKLNNKAREELREQFIGIYN